VFWGIPGKFIIRCLEVSGIGGIEATRIRYRVFNQLGGEFVRQKLGKKTDTTSYLQVIMQEFSRYGEKYLSLGVATEQSPLEGVVNSYFRNNPGTDALSAYNALKDNLIKGENDTRTLTYQQFKKLLSQMQKKGLVRKKMIEAPLEYRLMIRNIAAMQKLRQRWSESA